MTAETDIVARLTDTGRDLGLTHQFVLTMRSNGVNNTAVPLEALDRLRVEINRLRAENAALRQECAVEKERASVLLEAAWEVMSQFGVTDTAADEILVPAILKADGDPEYARTTIAEMRAAFPDDHHLRARLLKELGE